jgi:hypothetical protein
VFQSYIGCPSADSMSAGCRPASRRPLDEDAAAILLPTAGFATATVAEAVPPGLYFVTIQVALRCCVSMGVVSVLLVTLTSACVPIWPHHMASMDVISC